MLAKLRVATEAAEIVALSTVRGQDVASFGVSSSFLVGMVAAEPSQMEKPQLRKPSCFKSVSFVRTCFESLSRNFAGSVAKSFPSLTLHSLSLQRSNSESLTLTKWSLPIDNLTLPSLSFPRGNLESLTLQSLSLTDENSLQGLSFKERIFGDGSLEETAENLDHSLTEGGAGTNSFSNLRFQERMLAQEAGTNSFCTHEL